MKINYFIKRVLSFICALLLPLSAFAEDVKITTYYPSPYGSYKQLQVQNGDENTDITKFTQELTQAGLSIITDYTDTAYTPGIFWSTQNDNATKPKAGIWMYEATAGSKLLFDTSNDYFTGLNSPVAMTIDKDGKVGIGTESPRAALDVARSNSTIILPAMTSDPSSNLVEGMVYYDSDDHKFRVYQGSPAAWTDMVAAAGGGAGVCNSINTGPTVAPSNYYSLSMLSGTRNICEDDGGCFIRTFPYSGTTMLAGGIEGHLFQKDFSGNKRWVFSYQGSLDDGSGGSYWGTYATSGKNGDSTQTPLISTGASAYGIIIYDDHPTGAAPTESSSNTLTFLDWSTGYAFYVTICD